MNDLLLKPSLTNSFDTPLTEGNENLTWQEDYFNYLITGEKETEPTINNGNNTSFSTEDLSSTQAIVTSPLNDERSFQETQQILPPVQTVDFVDLERYDGLWYEVARTSNPFQFGCTCTTATYELLSDTSISVFNSCNRFLTQGPRTTIEGVAEVVDPETNAKLEVDFEGVPFPGDYWIIDLVEENPQSDYTYAVVSDPNRSTLFILSRTPNADPEILEELYDGLEAQFYDTDEIFRSPQPRGCEYPSLESNGNTHNQDPLTGVGDVEILAGIDGVADTFLLGDETDYFYDEAGTEDVALIEQFNPSDGDRIQLYGEAADYQLVEGNIIIGQQSYWGTSIFLDGDDFDDELIAVVQDTNKLNLMEFSIFRFV